VHLVATHLAISPAISASADKVNAAAPIMMEHVKRSGEFVIDTLRNDMPDR